MPLVLKNRTAAAGCRCLALASLTGAAAATWIAWQEGYLLAGSWRLVVVLAVIWSTGLVVCWHALSEVTTVVEVIGPGHLRLIQTSLLSTARTDIEVATTRRIAVATGRDDEDLPYYRGMLIVEHHHPVAVSEGYCRDKVENDVRRLQQALEG